MVLAQATSAGSPLDFIQYGVLGLVIIGLLLGWLWAKPAVDRMLKDKERAEAQRDDLLKVYEEKVMPATVESTQAITAILPVLERVARLLERFDHRGSDG